MPFFQGEQEAEMQKEVLKEPTYVEELLTLSWKRRTARKNLRLS